MGCSAGERCAFAGGAVPSSGRKGAGARLYRPRAWHTGLTSEVSPYREAYRQQLTSSQPKYSPAVFPTGDASRMEGESRRDMIRNGGLI